MLKEDMKEAGKAERELAEKEGRFHKGVPSIAVLADAGWSKRSHKHSYVAYSGVAVVIGMRTSKLLGMTTRYKYRATCGSDESQNLPVPDHTCYRNWSMLSSAMEPDMVLKLFLFWMGRRPMDSGT